MFRQHRIRQAISDRRTWAFVAKRTATGNTRREIMRMLQRFIAREFYPLITEALRTAATLGLTQGHQRSVVTTQLQSVLTQSAGGVSR